MDFIFDPSLVLYLPLYQLDGASFMSRDAHGHPCTVTGALWRPNGRKFDGTDDNITCGGATDIQPAKISAEAWIYFAKTMSGHEIPFGNTASNLQTGWALYWYDNKMRVYIQHYANNVAWKALTPDDSWHHAVGTYDGATIKIFVDGIKGTDDTYATGINYTGSGGTILGAPKTGGGAYSFSSVLGEARLYSRVLTPLEIQHNYLATKWRYR